MNIEDKYLNETDYSNPSEMEKEIEYDKTIVLKQIEKIFDGIETDLYIRLERIFSRYVNYYTDKKVFNEFVKDIVQQMNSLESLNDNVIEQIKKKYMVR